MEPITPNNIRGIIKKRFGYEPGDKRYFETIQQLNANPGYGLPSKKEIILNRPEPVVKQWKSGLGGQGLTDELTRRDLYSGHNTGTPDLKMIFSKAFGL